MVSSSSRVRAISLGFGGAVLIADVKPNVFPFCEPSDLPVLLGEDHMMEFVVPVVLLKK